MNHDNNPHGNVHRYDWQCRCSDCQAQEIKWWVTTEKENRAPRFTSELRPKKR